MTNTQWSKDVLAFWFQELSENDWFVSSEELDETIKSRFLDTHMAVSERSSLSQQSTPHEALASIIVLDQFSRNMFRGTAQAFASDGLALQFCKQAIDQNIPDSLSIEEKRFLFMPLMHSENLEDQETSVAVFSEIGQPEHAIEHRDLIIRFGRFPHRNTVLSRASTEAELIYLEDGKRFGQ